MSGDGLMSMVAHRALSQGENRRHSGKGGDRFSPSLRGSKPPVLEIGFCYMCEKEGVLVDGFGWVPVAGRTEVLCNKHHEEADRRAAAERNRKAKGA